MRVPPHKEQAGTGPAPRRRPWRRLCRVGVLALFVLAAAGATLPWWAPTGLLRDRLANELSRRMRVKVSIGEVSLSWTDGVIIRDIVVPSPAGFQPSGPGDWAGETPEPEGVRTGPPPLVAVKYLRVPLSLVSLLRGRMPPWVEIEQPEVSVAFDAQGKSNLAPLLNLHERLEQLSQPERVSIRRGSVSVQLPRRNRRIGLRVSDLQVFAGRVMRIGRMTMSGDLAHGSGTAPVSMRLEGQAAELDFADVDLEQLDLPRLLKLPLRLAGNCGGAVKLDLSQQGGVNRFDVRLTFESLDVQLDGVAELPVVDRAELCLAGVWDTEAQGLDFESIRLSLPGVEIAGPGSVVLVAADDGPRSVSQPFSPSVAFKLAGTVRPEHLPGRVPAAATRSSRPLEVVGPVEIALDGRYGNARLGVGLSVWADAAELRRFGARLKERGQPLRLLASGVYDLDRRWLDPAKVALTFGRNEITIGGLLREPAKAGSGRGRTAAILGPRQILSRIECQCSWRIAEPGLLSRWSPRTDRLLKNLHLGKQELTGSVQLNRPEQGMFHAYLTIPADARLSVPGQFVKPDNVPIGATLSGMIDQARPILTDLQAGLHVGPGRLAIRQGKVMLHPPPDPAANRWGIDASGQFDAAGVESLLACFVRARALAAAVSGRATGKYAVRFVTAPNCADGQSRVWGSLSQANLSADVTRLGIETGLAFVKPAGSGAQVQIEISRGEPAAAAGPFRVSGRVESPEVSAVGEVFVPHLAMALPRTGKAVLRAKILDANRFIAFFPTWAEHLARTEIVGAAELTGEANWRDETLRGSSVVDATELGFVRTGRVRRVKRWGLPAGVLLEGSLRLGKEHRAAAAELSVEAVLGDSSVSLAAAGPVDIQLLTTSRRNRPLWAAPPRRARLDARIAVDEDLCRVLPEVADAVKHRRIGGIVSVRGRLDRHGKSLAIQAALDAKQLAVGTGRSAPQALKTSGADGLLAAVPRWLASLGKPAGVAARVELDLVVPASRQTPGETAGASESSWKVRIRDFRVRLADAGLDAQGTLELTETGSGSITASPVDAHAAVWVSRAETLHRIVPALRDYSLTGSVALEAEYSRAHPKSLPYLSLDLQRLGGRFRGRDVQFGGRVVLEGIRSPDNGAPEPQGYSRAFRGLPTPARVKTDGLCFRVGANRGCLVADLRALPETPTGSVTLLAEQLDDSDLGKWLASTAPSSAVGGKLSPEEARRCRDSAQRLIDRCRPMLAAADLRVRACINRLHTYSPAVRQSYDAHELELNASVRHGRLEAAYITAFNGGSLWCRYDLSIAGKKPASDETSPCGLAQPVILVQRRLRDAIAAENMDPQLTRFFPGNTPRGLFSRVESIRFPLRDLLASAIDGRYKVIGVGTGMTVTTDGVVEGRAGPGFVARLLPALKNTQYHYRKMTGFATYRPDGVAVNDMIFDGKSYDLYMTGTTDADNIARYEVGLSTLGRLRSPEWRHRFRQGRWPLFHSKARIDDFSAHDVEVRYLWPHEWLWTVLGRNNVFYRLWLLRRPGGDTPASPK